KSRRSDVAPPAGRAYGACATTVEAGTPDRRDRPDPVDLDVRRPARRAASGEPPANPRSGVRARWRSPDRRGSTWRRESRLPSQTGSGPVRAAATTQWTTSLPENAEGTEA